MATDWAHRFGVHDVAASKRAVAANAVSIKRDVAASSELPFTFMLTWSAWAKMPKCSLTAAGVAGAADVALSAMAISTMALLVTKPIAKR